MQLWVILTNHGLRAPFPVVLGGLLATELRKGFPFLRHVLTIGCGLRFWFWLGKRIGNGSISILLPKVTRFGVIGEAAAKLVPDE